MDPPITYPDRIHYGRGAWGDCYIILVTLRSTYASFQFAARYRLRDLLSPPAEGPPLGGQYN